MDQTRAAALRRTRKVGQKKFGPFAEAVSGFREKYGPPRDLKAEARGFASGKREINRLKRQGK